MDLIKITPAKIVGSCVLLREDFDAGPVNLDRIEIGLWLGNLTAATDLDSLDNNKVTHVLTVDSCPLPKNISQRGMKNKFIQVTDMPHEDLLSHFDETYDFIKDGQESGVVLVHCYFGVSRSATIVIAFVMKKYNLSFKEALKRVKSKRRFVGPNPGFESQLKLYERMNWMIDLNCLPFRMFRLQIAADKVRKVKILPRECADVVRPDPALVRVRPDPLVYRCCKCRQIVASACNLLPHIVKEKPSWKDPKWAGLLPGDQQVCKRTHFVEPMIWMRSVQQAEHGKIHCPKCDSKLGSFSWTMGCQCPCGAKVSPAFYFVPSKVEWSNFVQNVQVTV